MILAAVFLAGFLVGALTVAVVLAWLEWDAGACGYVDLTGRMTERTYAEALFGDSQADRRRR